MTSHLPWRKSTYSGENGGCVEIATLPGNRAESDGVQVTTRTRAVALRDSKNPAGPILMFTPEDWRAFLHMVINDNHS